MCIAANHCWSFVYCVLSCVYFCYLMCIVLLCVCIAVLHTLVARLLARSQYLEGPVTGDLSTGFPWFPCVYKRMLRWFPRLQVATACFSCSLPDFNFLDPYFMFMYVHNNHCHRLTAHLQSNILLLLLLSSSSNFSLLSLGWEIFTYPGM